MFTGIVRSGSFALVVLASILCSQIAYASDSSRSNAESKNIDSIQRLFLFSAIDELQKSFIDELQKSVLFNSSTLEKIFGCKFTVDWSWWPYGPHAKSKDLNSTLIEQVEALLPDNGPSGNTGRKIFIYLKPNTSVTIDQVKRHFGIDAHTFTDTAEEDQPVEYYYHRKWGLLTFLCPHGEKTVQRIWLVE
jgi:hypothetical protein